MSVWWWARSPQESACRGGAGGGGESDPRRRAARTRPGSAATGDAGRSSVQCRSVRSGQLRRLTGHDLRSADASGSAAAATTQPQLLPGAADRMVSNAGACSAVSAAGLGQGAYGTEDLVAAEGFGGSGRSEASGRSPSARRAGNIVFGQSSRRAGRSSRAREGTRGNSAQRLCDGVVEGGRPALSGGVVVKACQEGAFPRPAVDPHLGHDGRRQLVEDPGELFGRRNVPTGIRPGRPGSLGAEELDIRLDSHLTGLFRSHPTSLFRGKSQGIAIKRAGRRPAGNRLRVTASRWCPCRPPGSP